MYTFVYKIYLSQQGNWNVILEAANNGLVETVDVLLERGANPDSMSDVSHIGKFSLSFCTTG